MNIIKKIKAFFVHQDETVELDLVAAEIKEGKAFLHLRGEENITYLVKSDDIDIILNKGRSLEPKDILKVERKHKEGKNETKEVDGNTKKQSDDKTPKTEKSNVVQRIVPTASNEFDRFKKKKFVVSLYPSEYETVMTSMKEYGYKRADFVMACVNSATKGSMEKAHKKIVKTHKELVKEQKAMESRK